MFPMLMFLMTGSLSCVSCSTESDDVFHAWFSLVFPIQQRAMMFFMPGSILCFLFNGEP